MIILDLVVVPNRGTILIVSTQDPDFDSVVLGSKVQQGDVTWTVFGLEHWGNGKPTGGFMVSPVSPMPVRGEATLLSP